MCIRDRRGGAQGDTVRRKIYRPRCVFLRKGSRHEATICGGYYWKLSMAGKNKNIKCQELGRPGAGPTSFLEGDEGGRSSDEQIKLSLPGNRKNTPVRCGILTPNTPLPPDKSSERPKTSPDSSKQPKIQKKRCNPYNRRGGDRLEYTVEEKKEIFWCVTYGRHKMFPKKGTTKRTRNMLEQRGEIDKIKLERIPDASCLLYTSDAADERSS